MTDIFSGRNLFVSRVQSLICGRRRFFRGFMLSYTLLFMGPMWRLHVKLHQLLLLGVTIPLTHKHAPTMMTTRRSRDSVMDG